MTYTPTINFDHDSCRLGSAFGKVPASSMCSFAKTAVGEGAINQYERGYRRPEPALALGGLLVSVRLPSYLATSNGGTQLTGLLGYVCFACGQHIFSRLSRQLQQSR
jgi:hypothetical protein